MHATSVLTIRDRCGNALRVVDMRPLVIHLLAGLEQAGIARAVVTLGHALRTSPDASGVRLLLKIDFVYMTLGSAVGGMWRNLANSVLAARSASLGARCS